MHSQRRKRLGSGVGRDSRFLEISDDPLVLDHTSGVLSSDHVVRIDGMDRLQHLDLLVAYRLGLERDRWFHCGDGQHLKHVVLHDVPDGADLLVQHATTVDPERFCDCDLHACNGIAVPDALRDRVAEAKHE